MSNPVHCLCCDNPLEHGVCICGNCFHRFEAMQRLVNAARDLKETLAHPDATSPQLPAPPALTRLFGALEELEFVGNPLTARPRRT
jgi:hypothetical protein